MLGSIHPAFHQYAGLRQRAMTTPIGHLQLPRPKPDDRPICHKRTMAMAIVLLLFDFNYGDFIRWLGGPYTNFHRDWEDLFTVLEAVASQEPPPAL